MHIKPIISAMLRSKTITLLIVFEIALTLAFVSNAVSIVYANIEILNKTTGMEIDNFIAVHPQGYSSQFDIRQAVDDDLATMRNTAGVVNASPVIGIPGVGGGRAGSFYIEPKEEANFSKAYYYQSDHSIIDTLGIKIVSGRDFRQDDIQYLTNRDPRNPGKILISQALADKLFPDSNATGKTLWLNHTGEPIIIIGVYDRLTANIYDTINREMSAIFPQVIYEQGYDPNYIVRTEPSQAERLVAIIDEKLSQTPGRSIADILTIKEYRSRNLGGSRVSSIILVVVTVLLVVITSLGIAGLTAYSVNKRRKQIGTRRALGATKADILMYFLIENWIMTTFGIILGAFLALLISLGIAQMFNTDPMSVNFILFSILGLWTLGFLAVLGPAKRASEIEPAIATRSA